MRQSVLWLLPCYLHDDLVVTLGHSDRVVADIEPNWVAIEFVLESEVEPCLLLLLRTWNRRVFRHGITDGEELLDIVQSDFIDGLWDSECIRHRRVIEVLRNVVQHNRHLIVLHLHYTSKKAIRF